MKKTTSKKKDILKTTKKKSTATNIKKPAISDEKEDFIHCGLVNPIRIINISFLTNMKFISPSSEAFAISKDLSTECEPQKPLEKILKIKTPTINNTKQNFEVNFINY